MSLKVGDWVRLNTDEPIVWLQGGDSSLVDETIANVIFVVTQVTESDYCVQPHDMFRGLFEVGYDGEFSYKGELVFDFYYPNELVLVESVDD